jgi:membrane-bound lytic murein transglycosylase D
VERDLAGRLARHVDVLDVAREPLVTADGLVRAGQWEPHIRRVFRDAGLPQELASLPHVESSFNPGAYSKVGAAGLWQFMPGTGKRFLRIDRRWTSATTVSPAKPLLRENYRSPEPGARGHRHNGAGGMAP